MNNQKADCSKSMLLFLHIWSIWKCRQIESRECYL